MYHLRSHFLPAVVALSTVPLIILTGCGASTSFSNPTVSSMVTGKIYGGQQPVVGATVTVWAAGITGYGSTATSLATTNSLSDGSFSFPANSYPCLPGEQVYITAQSGSSSPGLTNPNIMLATGLGDCSAAQTAVVEINEVTTAATAFALAQFFTPTLGSSSADSFGTDPADLTAFTNSNKFTIPMLVNVPNGTVNPNTASITIESAKIYSIANTLAACVNDAAGFANCQTLFTDTTPPYDGATAPTDTLQAAVQMALYPYQNVEALYQLVGSKPPFIGLATQPNDWTLGVSYTSSNYALSIAGTAHSATSASIDIDASGKVWFPTNLSGSTGVAYFDPTATATTPFNGPYIAGILTQPQYVSIDSQGYIWASDNASNVFAAALVSSPTTYGGFTLRGVLKTGAIAADDAGDVWFSYIDNSNTPNLGIESGFEAYATGAAFNYAPTGLLASDDFVYASTSGTNTPCALEEYDGDPIFIVADTSGTPGSCTSGGVAYTTGGLDTLSMATSLDQFCIASAAGCGTPPSSFSAEVNLPQGIATDGHGNEWVANSGNASVFTFSGSYTATSPVAYLHDFLNGATLTTPYAIAIDGSGNVWIANASCVTTSVTACTPGAFVLSELIGAAGPTITPLSAQMLGDGALVCMPPGTVIPTDVSAHPHRSGDASKGLAASAKAKGKLLSSR